MNDPHEESFATNRRMWDERDSTHLRSGGSYAERDAMTVHNESHEWPYSLNEVVEALRAPGLRVEFVHEFPVCCFAFFPWLVKGAGRWWRLPEGVPEFPMTFSLKAFKPAEVC